MQWKLSIEIQGQDVQVDKPPDADAAAIESAIESIVGIEDVTVAFHGGATAVCSDACTSTLVTFTELPGNLPQCES